MYSTAAQFRAYLQSIYRQRMSFQDYLDMLAQLVQQAPNEPLTKDEARRQLGHEFNKSAECAR
jgi:hypothetical protein